MKRLLVVAMIGVLGLVSLAVAVTDVGMREIQIQGSLSLGTNDDTKDKDYDLAVQCILNYFLGPRFSVGISAMMLGDSDEPEEGDTTVWATGFGLLRFEPVRDER